MTTLRFLLLPILAGLLAACVSSDERPQSPTDAAQYNARLGIEYLRQGNVVNARDKIERALKQDPRSPSAHIAAAFLYETLNDEPRVIQHYETAIRLKSDDPETLNNYGVYLCRRNRPEEGEPLILKAARDQMYRTPEVAYTNAGLCIRGAGRTAEAEKHFLQALTLQPRYQDALLPLAQIAFDRGRFADARIYVLRYFGAGRPTPESLELAMRTERGLGNISAAEGYARRLKAEFPESAQARAIVNNQASSQTGAKRP